MMVFQDHQVIQGLEEIQVRMGQLDQLAFQAQSDLPEIEDHLGHQEPEAFKECLVLQGNLENLVKMGKQDYLVSPE